MIQLTDIKKAYRTEYDTLQVLKGINLEIEKGEMVSIMGASGSGKSTLMNIIGLLDTYDSGTYLFDNKDMKNLDSIERSAYRSRNIGFVFQAANLISYKNVVENVALPLFYQILCSIKMFPRRSVNKKPWRSSSPWGLPIGQSTFLMNSLEDSASVWL